nr:restriction endonuclease [uncultured Psychroserpens sp.]
MNHRDIAHQFNLFLEKLFTSLSIEVEITDGIDDGGIDLVLKYEGKIVVAEVKAYRSKHIGGIQNALAKLNFTVRNAKAKSGILVISSLLESSRRKDLEKKYEVKIIDRNILFYLTKDDSDLRHQLQEFLLELTQTGDENLFEDLNIPTEYSFFDIWKSFHLPKRKEIKPVTKGADLCREMKAISLGKKGAYLFEEKCEEILKYLFEDDLSLWSSQNKTDDTLHRFDLITKISSINDFWKYLARDFKSRFIIFEFKNYTHKITQNQIYSTEKYLFTKALRSIAYIITRNGADKNAITAMRGSLRESGKLIMCLDELDICKMLDMKDNGDDPNTYLSDKVDNILIKLSR